jgi:protein TonB
VPGGQAGGVLGGIIGGTGAGLPPPPKVTPKSIRVGGNVAQANLIRQVTPVYPAIAKTAHISGTVLLHAIIGKDGTVQDLQYISGPPLLMKSAMDAVRQWRYKPTLLNGDPVDVDTTISVVFTLGG